MANAPDKPVLAKIDLLLKDKLINSFPLNQRNMVIGRREDCDICVPTKSASRHHAQIFSVLDQTFVLDLDSKNGTVVNQRRVKKHELKDGDTIKIGQYLLVYSLLSDS